MKSFGFHEGLKGFFSKDSPNLSREVTTPERVLKAFRLIRTTTINLYWDVAVPEVSFGW